MTKSMFLLEVYEKSIYGNSCVVKRRISDSISNIEDWLNANAQKWVYFPVEVKFDDYDRGTIHTSGNEEEVMYTFSISNIAVV